MKMALGKCMIRMFIFIALVGMGHGLEVSEDGDEDLKKGEPKVIDLELTGFNVLSMQEEESTPERMRVHIKKKCSQIEPADILAKSKTGITDNYIVTLCSKDEKNGFSKRFSEFISEEIEHPDPNLRAFKVKAEFNQLKRMAKHPLVLDIEQEELIKPLGRCSRRKLNATTQWNLDRIDQKYDTTLNGRFKFNKTYQSQVDVYVVDTGSTLNPDEYGKRLKPGVICIDSGCYTKSKYPLGSNSANTDLHGHGTHVIGTVGSDTYGVAKRVRIYPVKLMDHEGKEHYARFTVTTIVNALGYISKNTKKRGKQNRTVVNMSIGGGFSVALNRAVTDLTEQGITVVAAAGNSNKDAQYTSPASAETAITVGCVDKDDNFCSFSNTGKFVDILAPGDGIYSVSNTNGAVKMRGTSMSAPHVTGGVAAFMALYHEQGGLTPAQAKAKIIKTAAKDIIKGVPADTANKMLYLRCYK